MLSSAPGILKPQLELLPRQSKKWPLTLGNRVTSIFADVLLFSEAGTQHAREGDWIESVKHQPVRSSSTDTNGKSQSVHRGISTVDTLSEKLQIGFRSQEKPYATQNFMTLLETHYFRQGSPEE